MRFFEISALENPIYQIHQNRTNFRFQIFLGEPIPKNLSFFTKKVQKMIPRKNECDF